MNINNNNLLTNLTIKPVKDSPVQSMHISSDSFYMENIVNMDKQGVTISFKDEYLNMFKERNLIPPSARGFVQIIWNNGIPSAVIDTEGEAFKLSDDVVKMLCAEAQIDFTVDLASGKTTGRVDDLSFDFTHVRHNALDEENIWKRLTGEETVSPFIFPIKVEQLQRSS